jgi:MFS family permease
MLKSNWKRFVLGGLLAGLIINVVDYVVNGILLQQNWAAAMKALGKPETMTGGQIAAFNISGFLIGILTIWLYSAIRPRYGAGPKTALCAGSAVWALAYLLAAVPPVVLHILPGRLMAIGIVVGLVEVSLAALAGAWLYKEDAEGRSRTAPLKSV